MIRSILIMGITGLFVLVDLPVLAQDPARAIAPAVGMDGASISTSFAPATGGVPATLDGTEFIGAPSTTAAAATGISPSTEFGTGGLGAPSTVQGTGNNLVPSTSSGAGGDAAPSTAAVSATGFAPSTQYGSGSRSVPSTGDLDFAVVLPVTVSPSRVNGVTDRYGMPLMVRFGKSASSYAPAVWGNEVSASGNQPARPANRNGANAGRRLADPKTKTAKLPQRSLGARGGAVPQYYIPRGSLDWDPGIAPINTAPSDPYGYGYGTSGYGTEVFGDFWKGWPIVE